MIDPKELRLGNYILLRSEDFKDLVTGNPLPSIVTLLLPVSKDFDWQSHGDKFTPIPLTDAVLEACCKDWDGVNKSGVFDIQQSSLYVSYDEDGWYVSSLVEHPKDMGLDFILLTYLHQLQNLYFALTGKELEIDEEKLKAAL